MTSKSWLANCLASSYPMPEDAPVTTASGRWLSVAMARASPRRARRNRIPSEPRLRTLLGRAVRELGGVGGRMDRPHRGQQPRRPRRVHVADHEPGGHPLRDAVRAHEQLAGGVAQPAAPRRLLKLAVPRLLLKARERRTQRARDLVLGDQAADLVGRHAREHEVLRAPALRKLAPRQTGGDERAAEARAKGAGQHGIGAERAMVVVGGVVGAELARQVGLCRAHGLTPTRLRQAREGKGDAMLEGKVVAVTGASAGIGRATVREFAERGAHVGLIARGEERLENAAAEVRKAGVKACVAPADVSDAEAVERAAQRIEDELGRIDIWVNVAMTAVLAEVADTSAEEFKRVTEVTYLGSVHGVQTALRRMLPRDEGVIVQVGSALSRRGIPLQATYCGSKHAIKGFLDSLRAELIHHRSNVKVALVQLPGLNTPQFNWVRTRLHKHPQPVAPIYQPEVAARAIVYAAEHPRRELWVGGSTVYTILGEKFVSTAMDIYLGRTNEQGQEADIPIDPSERTDTLFSPPPGAPGAHGIFDDKAHPRSPQWWLNPHRRHVAAGAVAVAAAVAAAARR